MKYVSLFSVLHLAVDHGREQLVHNIVERVQQLPPTEPKLVDGCNRRGEVSDL